MTRHSARFTTVSNSNNDTTTVNESVKVSQRPPPPLPARLFFSVVRSIETLQRKLNLVKVSRNLPPSYELRNPYKKDPEYNLSLPVTPIERLSVLPICIGPTVMRLFQEIRLIDNG